MKSGYSWIMNLNKVPITGLHIPDMNVGGFP
jgi:hypothetical protein